MILSILLVTLLLASIYILTVLTIQFCKQTDTKTAKSILLKFLKELCASEAPEFLYPVYIGIDNMGIPHADVIEQEFKKLSAIFKCVHFNAYRELENRLLYCFNVEFPLEEMEEYDLVKYCEAVCDDIVHKYIHKQYPAWGHINNLVFVYIQDNILYLYIAKKYTGTVENAIAKDNRHKFYTASSNVKINDTIEESWDD